MNRCELDQATKVKIEPEVWSGTTKVSAEIKVAVTRHFSDDAVVSAGIACCSEEVVRRLREDVLGAKERVDLLRYYQENLRITVLRTPTNLAAIGAAVERFYGYLCAYVEEATL